MGNTVYKIGTRIPLFLFRALQIRKIFSIMRTFFLIKRVKKYHMSGIRDQGSEVRGRKSGVELVGWLVGQFGCGEKRHTAQGSGWNIYRNLNFLARVPVRETHRIH